MSSESRENVRLWPVAFLFTLLLVICLGVVGVRWQFNPPPDAPQTKGAEAPARIGTDSELAKGPALEPHVHDELPGLGSLAVPARRADTYPTVADHLPLTPPIEAFEPDNDSGLPLSEAQLSDEEVEELNRQHFDWQDAVLAPAPPLTAIWTEPHLLLSRLDQLPLHDEVIAWRSEVQLAIEELLHSSSLRSSVATAALHRLASLQAETPRLESLLPPTMYRYRMHATADTLRRNVVVWRAAQEAAIEAYERGPIEPDMQVMLRALDRIEAEIDKEEHAESWRAFLETEQLWRIARAGNTSDLQARVAVADRVLQRLDKVSYDDRQQAVMQREEFAALVDQLRIWAYRPQHYESLLYELQRYEAVGRQREASEIVRAANELARSPLATDRALAEVINDEYRGAGMRIAVTETLLNRFLPTASAVHQPVADRIRGADVRGESRVVTGLNIRLQPDANRLRLGLEASGNVTSNTAARKGPATFYSQGRGSFLARKMLLHDGRKLFVWRSDVSARLDNQLSDFQTEYDDVPLINMFARSMALQQHDEEAPHARREAEQKLRDQLRERIDGEIHTRLFAAEEKFNEKVLEPLNELGLEPSITNVRTTETRLISHYRLAGKEQLSAAHTRPWAPSASLLSTQLHQSTVNNIIDRLELAGREVELRELYEELADTFKLERSVIPEDLPEGVMIHFADEEPVRVDFHNNTVSLTLRIRQLTGNGKRFRDFTVRAHFQPTVEDLDARLFRRSYVELIGDRLSFGDQIALRGVFSKTFNKQRPIKLIDERLVSHEAFKGLALIQLQIEYGWIALAIGREGDLVVGKALSKVAERQGQKLR